MTNTVTLSVTRFYYDGDGTRLKQVESKGGTTITTAYAGAIEVTITGTQRITQAYYLAGAQRVATRIITTSASYDTWGNPVVVTDALGRPTRTEYDSQYHLYPEHVTNVQEQSADYDYDRARGLLLTATDPNSAITYYGYDAFGRLTSVTKPGDEANPTLSYTYADRPAPWKVETRQRGAGTDTLDTAQYYDGLGRLLQTRAEAESGQRVTRVVYDALGRKQIEYTPKFDSYNLNYHPNGWESQPRTTMQYDALGRTTVITAPDGRPIRTGYQGWTTAVTDTNSHKKDSTADAYGRLIAVKEYSGTAVYTTTYGYDTLGNLTRVTDTLNHTTVITYDALGRKTAMNDPDMGRWSYEYDAAGNLITQTDALGRQLVFGYDALNRVTGKWSVESGVWKELARYGYDQGANGIGQRTAMTDVTGVTAWAFDARGRVVAETRSITTGLGVYTTSFTYDSADRVVAMTYPDGEVVTSGYNPAGLPYTLTSSLGEWYVSGATYDAAGQVTQMNLGNNGLVTDYGYDSQMHRLTAIRTWAGQSPVLSLTYGYDPVGNVKAITDTTNNGQVQRFDYDPLDRLTRGYTTGGDHGVYDESYAYDQIGNLTSKGPTGTLATYGYTDTAHIHAVTRLSGGPNGGSRFGYDANGNMTLRVEVSGTQVMTYYQQFNAENRLTVVTATNGITQSVTCFAYDGDGARVLQITEAGTTIYIGDHYEEFLPGVQIPNLQAQVSDILASNLRPATFDRQSLISDVQPPARGKTPGWASPARVSATTPTGPRTLTLPPLRPATLAYLIGYDDDDWVWSYTGANWTVDQDSNAYGGAYHRGKPEAWLTVPNGMNAFSIRFGGSTLPPCQEWSDSSGFHVWVDGTIVWERDMPPYSEEAEFSVTSGSTHTVRLESPSVTCGGRSRNWEFTVDAASFQSADQTPPTTTASVSCTGGTGGWCKSNATMTLSAADSSGVLATRYNLDSAGWLTYSVPFGVTGNATHLIEYYSIDNFNNQEDPHPTTMVKIDTVAPTTTASTACTAEGGWCKSNATVTLSAVDSTSGVTTTHYRVDSGNWNTYIGSTVASSVTGELTHTVGYYAKDKAGNLGATLTHTVTIDAGPPTTTVSVACAQVGDWCLSTPVTVTLSAQDSASGVAATYYRVNGGNQLTYTNPLVFVTGTYQVSYYSWDKAGYQETPHTRNVRIDLGSMTRIDPSPPQYANSAISLTWVTSQTTPTVAFATLWVSPTLGDWASTGLTRTSGSDAFLYTPGGDGDCCFATVGTDAAWNSEAAPTGSGDGCTTYDHTAPTITSLIVPARATPDFAVSWSAQDNLTGVPHYDVQYKSESSGWTDWVSTPVTQALFTGPGGHTYTFRVSATDGVGNESYWQTSGQVTVPLVKKYYAAAGRRVAMRVGDMVYYLHGDHLGSTSLVTTGAGAEVARQMYLPYGAPRWGSGTLPTDFTFTGQRADATGLMYYRARYYSSSLGRFVSPDTIIPNPVNPQLFNRYSYAGNNPILYNDPDGHCGALCGIVIAGYVALDVAVAVALADVVDSHGWAYEPEYHKQYIEQTASRHSVVLPPTALGAALGVQAEGQIWAADVGQAMFKGLFGDLLHMGNTASVGPAQMRPGEYNSHDTWTLLNNHEAGIEALAAKMAAADQEFMLTSEAYNYKSSMTDHMIVLAIGQNSGPFGAQSLFGNYYKSGRIDWAAWFAGDDRNAAAQTCPGNCRGWADYQRLHMGGLRSNLNSFLQQLNELTEYGWQLPEGVDWDELDRLAGGSK